MHRLSLEHITVWDASPPETVRIAADLGCSAVSLFVQGAGEGVEVPPLATDPALLRSTKAAMAETGVRLQTAECFVLAPETEVAACRPALALAAELGAAMATAIAFDDDNPRMRDNFFSLAELAREYGLVLNIEFLAFSSVASLQEAAQLARACTHAQAGVVVDALHLYRSGGQPEDIASLPPGLVKAAQICDGPPEMAADLQPFYEGFEQRLLPGEGVFPLTDFVRYLPEEVTIGVEVPQRKRREKGISPRERAALAVSATRRILESQAAT